MMDYYFYARISTSGQQVDSQVSEFKKNIEFKVEKVFIDKISGSVHFFQRPKAVQLFDELTFNKNPKTLIVYSWDRLGRNLIDVLQTVELLTSNGINIKSIKEGVETLLPNGKPNPVAKITLSILSNLAEMNLEMQREKCKDGIAQAKLRGAYKGRKLGSTQTDAKLLERHQMIVKKLQKQLTIREIQGITGCSSATIIKVKKVMIKRKMFEV